MDSNRLDTGNRNAGNTTYSDARLIVVMGTTGCGKSTIGEAISRQLNARYVEGDDYHSVANKSKMSAGIALTDDDRWPWLQTLAEAMCVTTGKMVTSCSALKRTYRDFITKNANEPVLFVHLHGSRELLANRLSQRQGHFMPTALLDSQLATLELPQREEFSFTVDIDANVDEIVAGIMITIAGGAAG